MPVSRPPVIIAEPLASSSARVVETPGRRKDTTLGSGAIIINIKAGKSLAQFPAQECTQGREGDSYSREGWVGCKQAKGPHLGLVSCCSGWGRRTPSQRAVPQALPQARCLAARRATG
jgi:hypothetical protein